MNKQLNAAPKSKGFGLGKKKKKAAVDFLTLFSDHDPDGEGLVSRKDFSDVVNMEAALLVNKAEMKELYKRFSVAEEDDEESRGDKSARIDYASFRSCLESNDSVKVRRRGRA